MGSWKSLAYKRALVPLYGGGRNSTEIAESYAKVAADINDNTLRVELLNPTRESFDDFATNAALNAKNGACTIPNAGLAHAPNLKAVGSASGQTLQDANLIKLRITHGYALKVPLMRLVYGTYLKWLDDGSDDFKTQLAQNGRIPVETHITLEMQSDPIEGNNVSSPGAGNGGVPVSTPPAGGGGAQNGGAGSAGPGTGAPGGGGSSGTGGGAGGGGGSSGGSVSGSGGTNPPPNCLTIGCTVANTPVVPGGTTPGGGSGESGEGSGPGGCSGANCPVCTGAAT